MVSFVEIVPYIIAVVIVFLIKSIIIKRFINPKPKRSIWIKYLRENNRIINKTLSKFEKIESTNNKWIELLKPIIPILVFLVIFILFIITFIFSGNAYIALADVSLITSLIILILGLYLFQYTSNKIKKGNLLEKANKIKDFYQFINWLFFGIISFILPSIYEFIVNFNKIPESNIEEIRLNYIISIIFIIATLIILIDYFRTLFFGRLKYEINKLYSKDFPTVHISTNVEILKGKISNIFDDDLIILDDDGVMKGTQWKDIIVITINHNPVLEE